MNIAILHGGTSTESAISTRNALCVQKALRENCHEATPADYGSEVVGLLRDIAPDVVFIAVQGPGHGDGVGQAVCEFMGLPYTGARSVDAAVINNKALCKMIAAHNAIPTPAFESLRKREWEAADKRALLKESCRKLGLPLVAKIVDQGGSFGLAYLVDAGDVDKIDEVFRYGDELIFEKFISGRFFTMGVLDTGTGTTVLPPITARGMDEYADPLQLFNRPYVNEPMILSVRALCAARERTLRIYRLFNCRGYARVDYMLDRDGEPQFIEVNAVPGLNEKSLFPYAASLEGIGMAEICESIVRAAIPSREGAPLP